MKAHGLDCRAANINAYGVSEILLPFAKLSAPADHTCQALSKDDAATLSGPNDARHESGRAELIIVSRQVSPDMVSLGRRDTVSASIAYAGN